MDWFLTLVATAGFASFWAITAFLSLLIVISLGVFRGIHTGSVLFVALLGLLYIRFDPPVALMVGIFFVWFVTGLLYARARWKLQFTKLKNRVVEAFQNFEAKRESTLTTRQARKTRHENDLASLSQDGPGVITRAARVVSGAENLEERRAHMVREWEQVERQRVNEEDRVAIDLDNCDLSAQQYVEWVEGDTLSTILIKFRPKFATYRKTIAGWAVVWPVYLIKDLTIDLVRNALELLHGNFQRAADQAFS